jgi:hypothetical protein
MSEKYTLTTTLGPVRRTGRPTATRSRRRRSRGSRSGCRYGRGRAARGALQRQQAGTVRRRP